MSRWLDQVVSEEKSVDLDLVVTKDMGGLGGVRVNPEKFFAAGYAACFLGAMRAVSSDATVIVPGNATVTATVGFGE